MEATATKASFFFRSPEDLHASLTGPQLFKSPSKSVKKPKQHVGMSELNSRCFQHCWTQVQNVVNETTDRLNREQYLSIERFFKHVHPWVEELSVAVVVAGINDSDNESALRHLGN